MKIQSKAILRIIFLFAVFTCSGIIVYDGYQTDSNIQEVCQGTNSVENRFGSEVNTFDDYQIYHSGEVSSYADFNFPAPIAQDYSIFRKFSCTVWQPPKIS
jgi:hypothetical protein